MKIAVTGKGGSGKTMLTAIMTKLLSKRNGLRLLAIDADSAVNLPYALGIEPRRTVAQIRRQIIEDPEARAQIEDKNIRVVMEEALEEGSGFNLLIMGRPEGPGCYCSINDLLKYGIDGLSKQFDITLIDCEAGPEQVNRRVVKGVDMLIIVTDPSIRGARVTDSIVEVVRSDESIKPPKLGIVINRLSGSDEVIRGLAHKWELEIIGNIPEDRSVSKFDADGRPLIELPDSSPSVAAVSEILKRVIP
jgi:CO dehydrogenase maturation factor